MTLDRVVVAISYKSLSCYTTRYVNILLPPNKNISHKSWKTFVLSQMMEITSWAHLFQFKLCQCVLIIFNHTITITLTNTYIHCLLLLLRGMTCTVLYYSIPLIELAHNSTKNSYVIVLCFFGWMTLYHTTFIACCAI